ncbi:toll/interleukin-1 receptor domain-containing protein [Streptomyces sp. HUAS TT20]|uniref:toll/interleukin-1 receptor domain-containing protein n=1 Tax=Streptomyces sp. HUAS TT20 TaxID=3447509 RepID=UPI0021DABBD8|nr:toll/interleukin-1 receptor domain-containing protein [Streptomyces sp. HUAS 15-9]UXY29939.1 toll/interleukin-1 receptor domain-containing protein [Streptomyces sp. HUAS 15-9]
MTDASPPAHSPKAFLSHASEDKASFTEPLARDLARLGIDPWLDRWEIRPGDSLVQKLFDEGLATADAVVVIVSRHSATKAWVREELDQGMVSRIERGTRLIPVRLDDVEVPAPLRHLVWHNAERSPEGIAKAAQEIADTLHGTTRKPSIGAAPTYTQASAQIPGLASADAFLLTLAIRAAIDTGHPQLLDWPGIERKANEAGLVGANLHESTMALAEQNYLDIRFFGERVNQADLTPYGYDAGIEAVMPDVDEGRRRTIALLVNDPPTGDRIMHELAERANVPLLVVRELLEDLKLRGLLSYSLTIGDHTRLHSVSPTLRRDL